VRSHCVTLHCVRVIDELVHPCPLILQATSASDVRKMVADQGLVWRGIFSVCDAVVDGHSHLALAVLCETIEGEDAGPVGSLIADEWILKPWLKAGGSKNLSVVDFHAWPAEKLNSEASKRPDLVAFISVLREGPSGLEIVLVEEPKRKWSQAGGRWFLPAGHIDANESFCDGGRRETLEEAGIAVEITGLMAFVHRCFRNGSGCMGPHLLLSARPLVDVTTSTDDRPILKTKPDEESLSAKWWPLDEIVGKVRSKDADSFFREAEEMRVHLEIVAARQGPVPINSVFDRDSKI